jgi:hypothetical protein
LHLVLLSIPRAARVRDMKWVASRRPGPPDLVNQ